MDIVSAILLGIVQGATEFLPVSSTGHLVLMHELLGQGGMDSLAFDAILHLATAAAVIVYFFDELRILFQTVLRKLGKMPVNEKDMTLIYALGLGTIPAVFLGLLLESYMETTLRDPLIVAGVLITGSIIFILAEYYYQNHFHECAIKPKTGFKIGLFQSLALIPGMSRSGITIVGGMFMGLSREDATKFAFLLAVPVILGAGAKKCLELIQSDVPVLWTPILAGAITAFVIGLLAIHFMISFVKRYSLWPFIWYRIVLASFVIFVVVFG